MRLTTQWTRMLSGTQNSREKVTTEATMLSARNFPNVLMSSFSINSHSRSTTSCTCLLHLPCTNRPPPPPTLIHAPDFNVRVSVCVSDVPLRHRSPRCRVCLYAGTGSCLFRSGTARRHHCCSDSRLYTTSWFLQRGQKQIQTLCCCCYSHKTNLLTLLW